MTQSFALHHPTLESFFFQEIEQVQERRGAALPQEVEAYVVGLLARYAKRTQVAGRKSAPLALQYLHAKSESGSARAHALRTVGDRALYISGVVPRSLARSAINVRYVNGIGEAAYAEVAGAGPLAVLGLLAEMFEEVADVVGDVMEPSAGESHEGRDLLGLYERWRTHGDPRDAKKLIAAGVLIETEGTDTVQ